MKEDFSLVTVIITTYKREPEMLNRAIKSVLEQTYKNIELIVIDDSPDTFNLRTEVKEMVQSYEGIIYIQHKKNRGACVARNTGLKIAHGMYIAFLDDDDEWMPTKIEKQIKCFDDEKVALVYCGHKIYYEKTNDVVNIASKGYEGYLYEKLLMEGNFIGSTSFVLMRKEYLEKIGGFDPLMESAQDADVWLRLAKQYNVKVVNEPLVIYHVHEGERITSNFLKKINGITRLIEKNKEYINEHSRVYSRYNRELACLYAKNGQFKEAVSKWWLATKRTPLMLKINCRCMYHIIKIYNRSES